MLTYQALFFTVTNVAGCLFLCGLVLLGAAHVWLRILQRIFEWWGIYLTIVEVIWHRVHNRAPVWVKLEAAAEIERLQKKVIELEYALNDLPSGALPKKVDPAEHREDNHAPHDKQGG